MVARLLPPLFATVRGDGAVLPSCAAVWCGGGVVGRGRAIRAACSAFFIFACPPRLLLPAFSLFFSLSHRPFRRSGRFTGRLRRAVRRPPAMCGRERSRLGAARAAMAAAAVVAQSGRYGWTRHMYGVRRPRWRWWPRAAATGGPFTDTVPRRRGREVRVDGCDGGVAETHRTCAGAL
ncbi:hypothetical protein BS78_08G055000 [Paspalum vaginatum]|nr:hypothetical protein BS78_08G055000 [Paspalum vaginatum]